MTMRFGRTMLSRAQHAPLPGTPEEPPNVAAQLPTNRPRHTIPLGTLLWRGVRALRHPHEAFRTIRADEQVPFLRLLLLMVAWGAPYALLHFRTIGRHWLWQSPPRIAWCLLLTFMLVAPTNWFLGSIGLRQVARWLKRPVTAEYAEIAAFYLWIVWALMPLVDVVHWFGWRARGLRVPLPGGFYLSFVAHAAWAFAFPWIVLELTAFFVDRLQGERHCLLKSLGLSVGLLIVVRGLWEPLFGLLCLASQRLAPAYYVGDWWFVMVGSGVGVVMGCTWRTVLRGGGIRTTVLRGALACAAVLLLAWPFRYPR